MSTLKSAPDSRDALCIKLSSKHLDSPETQMRGSGSSVVMSCKAPTDGKCERPSGRDPFTSKEVTKQIALMSDRVVQKPTTREYRELPRYSPHNYLNNTFLLNPVKAHFSSRSTPSDTPSSGTCSLPGRWLLSSFWHRTRWSLLNGWRRCPIRPLR